ncbi:hypothetical protein MMC28_002881 [Mycoblastus sanguinarius]|nr:hypothetical protein [Mycoblastus sanguinarius]
MTSFDLCFVRGRPTYLIHDIWTTNETEEEIRQRISSFQEIFQETLPGGKILNIVPRAIMAVTQTTDVAQKITILKSVQPDYRPIWKGNMGSNDRLITLFSTLAVGLIKFALLRPEHIWIHRDFDKRPKDDTYIQRDGYRLNLGENFLILHGWSELREAGRLRINPINMAYRDAWINRFHQLLPDDPPGFELYRCHEFDYRSGKICEVRCGSFQQREEHLVDTHGKRKAETSGETNS